MNRRRPRQPGAATVVDTVPLAEHLTGYVRTLRVAEPTAAYVNEVESKIKRVAAECGFRHLTDIVPAAFESWLIDRKVEGLSATTRNRYLTAMRGFLGWSVERGLLPMDPLAGVRRANQRADRRHVRRALSDDEVSRVLYATRWRPLAERGREKVWRTKPESDHKTWSLEPLSFDAIDDAVVRAKASLPNQDTARLDRLGLERYTFVKLLVTTGLRRDEARKLTLAWLTLAGDRPVVERPTQKNHKPLRVPLRRDMADELQHWVATMSVVKADGSPRRSRRPLPADTPVFNFRRNVLKWFKADLAVADVPHKDNRGRVVDIHALRYTFATRLANADVSLRYAQELLRHSDPKLTAQIYQDAGQFDLHASVEQLPAVGAGDENNVRGDASNGRAMRSSPGRLHQVTVAPTIGVDGVVTMAIDPVALVQRLTPKVRHQVAEAIERLDGPLRPPKPCEKCQDVRRKARRTSDRPSKRPPVSSSERPVVERLVEPSQPNSKAPTTLSAFIEHELAQHAAERSPNTVRNLRRTWRLLSRFYGDEHSLAAITTGQAEAFAEWLGEAGGASVRGLSPSTARSELKRARSFLAAAVRRGVIVRNPFDGVTVGEVRQRHFEYIDRDTVDRLLAVAKPSPRLIVAMIRFGGLRWVEVQRLEWTDVDFDTNELTIRADGTSRVVPISANLRPHLVDARCAASVDAVHVTPYQAVSSGQWVWRSLSHLFARIDVEPPHRLLEAMRRSYDADEAATDGTPDTLTESQRRMIAEVLKQAQPSQPVCGESRDLDQPRHIAGGNQP
ncbi:MAG: tyrosine-type recombinase/integrase [Pirellulales bacterium]